MSSKPDFQLFSSLRYDPQLHSLAINTEHWPAQSSSPYYMLPYHRDRLLQAANHFGWSHAASEISGPEGLARLLSKLDATIKESPIPLRVRTLLSIDGEITVESNPVPEVPKWNLYPEVLPAPSTNKEVKVSPLTGGALTLGKEDSLHGAPSRERLYEVSPDTTRTTPSPFTSYKTTSRDMYNDARSRVGILTMTDKKEVLLISDSTEHGNGEIMEGSLTSVYFWRDGKWRTPPVASGGQIGTTRRWALEKGFCEEGVVEVGDLVDEEECWVSNGVWGFIAGRVKLV